MSWLIDFFKSIGTLIVTVVSLLVHTLTSVFNLIAQLPSYLEYVLNWLACLPDFLFVFVVVIPMICIIWGLKKVVSV